MYLCILHICTLENLWTAASSLFDQLVLATAVMIGFLLFFQLKELFLWRTFGRPKDAAKKLLRWGSSRRTTNLTSELGFCTYPTHSPDSLNLAYDDHAIEPDGRFQKSNMQKHVGTQAMILRLDDNFLINQKSSHTNSVAGGDCKWPKLRLEYCTDRSGQTA